MSLRHALLGLLAREPASGYDLAKAFTGPLGTYAWQTSHTQIYPELKKLSADGLVQATDAGARGRRTYDITPAGHAELRDWLLDGSQRRSVVRSEFVLRLFLLSSLETDDARRWLGHAVEHCQRELDELRAVLDKDDSVTPADASLSFGRLAGEYGVRQYEAARDWALWAARQLDRG